MDKRVIEFTIEIIEDLLKNFDLNKKEDIKYHLTWLLGQIKNNRK
jgi:hypothetical protein